jgi:GNAT superfamily N-acetyltransferase
MNTDITVRRLDAGKAAALKEQLADVLLDCVEGGASVSFMLPMARSTALDFWDKVADGVARGGRTLLVAEDEEGVIGTVQLITGLPDNQPHRADVAKLLVHRRARNRGVGQQLMLALEQAAREQERWVLVLDTASAAAERLYERLGWQRVGVVPGYALLPNGELCGTTFYYKQLDGHST